MGTVHYHPGAAKLVQGAHKGSCGRYRLEYHMTADKGAVTCKGCKRTREFTWANATDVAAPAAA
jgi:hypothetical protein